MFVDSQQWAKIKIIGGMGVKYWGRGGGDVSPRDLQPCIQINYSNNNNNIKEGMQYCSVKVNKS